MIRTIPLMYRLIGRAGLSLDETIFLSYLVELMGRLGKDYGDWFVCRAAAVQGDMGSRIEPTRQSILLRSLKGKGMVETRLKGFPPKRSVRLMKRVKRLI